MLDLIDLNKKGEGRFLLASVPLTLVTSLMQVLAQTDVAHESRQYLPYQDGAGVWTVCAGITGATIIPMRQYRPYECDILEKQFIQNMFYQIGRCVHQKFSFHEALAWGHFAYNIGVSAFCHSTAAYRLNSGEGKSVCAEISKWVYVNGHNCRLRINACYGIMQRRAWERKICEGKK